MMIPAGAGPLLRSGFAIGDANPRWTVIIIILSGLPCQAPLPPLRPRSIC